MTLIEFADLQCPFCAQYTTSALPTVIEDYVRTGRLKMELRLLRFIGPDSERAAPRWPPRRAAEQAAGTSSTSSTATRAQENSGYVTDAFLRRVARGRRA